ncbi:hypothetical protein NTGM5_200001 [Candidatus Nitrotoga sp. M5]|nr:hypothetical protein NTGM5_200001 [Candidatus Nitrotoga sp. M5]
MTEAKQVGFTAPGVQKIEWLRVIKTILIVFMPFPLDHCDNSDVVQGIQCCDI